MSHEKGYDPYSYNPDSGVHLSSGPHHEKGYDPYSYNPDSGVHLSSGPHHEKGYDPYSYSPDSGVSLSSSTPSSEYINSVFAAQYAAGEEEREKARVRREKIDADLERSAAEREAAKKFNDLPPYKKLSEMLVFHAKHLSNSQRLEDVELSQTIYEGLSELRNRNFEPMNNVFKILETRAMNDPALAHALQDWEKFYIECKEALEKKSDFERKKTEYENVSFFGRVKRATMAFLGITNGKKIEAEAKGKKI